MKISGFNREELLEFLSHMILWYLTIVVLFSYIQIVFVKLIDILVPVQFLMIMGLIYWVVFIISGIIYHIKEKGFGDFIVLITEFFFAGLTLLGFTHVPSTLSKSVKVEIPLVFDDSFYTLFIVGLLAAIFGLALSIRNYGKKESDNNPKETKSS